MDECIPGWLVERFENHPWLWWIVAFGLAWLVFFVFNILFELWPFGHLDRIRAGSVGDYLRWSQTGRASSRVDPQHRKYEFFRQMFVTNKPAKEFLMRNRQQFNSGALNAQYDFLEKVLRTESQLQTNQSSNQLLEWLVRVIWVKHALSSEYKKTYESRFKDMTQRLGDLDPQTKEKQSFDEQFGNIQRDYHSRIREVNDIINKSKRVDDPLDFRKEIVRLVPNHVNQHINDYPEKDRLSEGTRTLAIFYFPPSKGAKSDSKASTPEVKNKESARIGSKGDEKSKSPRTVSKIDNDKAEQREKRYAFALEISQAGDWREGWSLQARYLLFDLDEPEHPIFSPHHPHIDIITRKWGWFGLRPAAVLTTEEQLTARYFSELETLAKGIGEDSPLKPSTTKDVEQHQRYIHRVLLDRLGRGGDTAWGRGVDEDKPESSFDFSVAPMSDWIVSVRRLNGGSWWGCIQFLVVILVCAFAIDLFQNFRLFNQVAKLLDKLTEQLPLLDNLCNLLAQP